MSKIMRHRTLLLATCVLLGSFLRGRADSPTQLAKELEPLKAFVGKTWKGHFKNSTPEKPVVDGSKWERAMNGQAIRVLHSVNKGDYGGETLIVWNAKTKRIEFFYFTTAGYFTQGTVSIKDGKLLTHEDVTGNENGVTAVEATTELLPNGKMHLKARYFKKGEWTEGHEVTYELAPGEDVVFK